MTDNEKRAHDFALAVLPLIYEAKVSQLVSSEMQSGSVDFYALYQDLYKKLLVSFNCDYPDQK